MDWRKLICYTIGCNWKCDDDGSHGIAGAFKCARCGGIWPAVVWPKVPPMPACKPPRTEQADRIEVVSLTAGDTLIISSDKPLTHEQRASIKSSAMQCLAPGCTVMVLDAGLSIAGAVTARRPAPFIPMPQRGQSNRDVSADAPLQDYDTTR